MNKNKKAISAVVATVLIILITVAAVTIIWKGVLPFVDKLEGSTVCLDAVQQIRLLDDGYTCRASNGANVSIQIKHLAKTFDLSDIQVLVSAGGDTTMFRIGNATTTLIPTGSNIPLPNANEERVYVINTSSVSGTINKVQVAPIVGVGNMEQICDVSAAQILQDC